MPARQAVLSQPTSQSYAREFQFSDEDFHSIAETAYRKTGIVLSEAKRNLVYGRLSRRLRQLGMYEFSQYRSYLEANDAETESFINAISTNLTKFFREAHHFDHLRENVAETLSSKGAASRRLRIWSAGCSTGEEPYSISTVLQHAMRSSQTHDVKILATDIDTEVIARGAQGEYSADAFSEMPRTYREAFKLHEDANGTVVMPRELRDMISFGRLNLIESSWPLRGPFDAIFCRNVMIYFDAPTKTTLVRRFTELLAPGGFLYLGHAESLTGAHPGLTLIGRTIYQRAE